MDNVQWEMVLRSVSAHRSFRYAVQDDYNAPNIASFLILDRRFPRSLAHCAHEFVSNLDNLSQEYGVTSQSLQNAKAFQNRLKNRNIDAIFE